MTYTPSGSGNVRRITIGMMGILLAACGGPSGEAERKLAELDSLEARVLAASAGSPRVCLDSASRGQDTLVFSDVAVEEMTEDAAGTEISLWNEGGAWRGQVRQAEGELGSPRPLQSLRLDPESGSLALAYANDQLTLFRFGGTFTCGRITGRWVLDPGTPARDAVLVRVPHSGVIPPPRPADDSGPADGRRGARTNGA